jgi:pimeloyl-ACP methyl ester carboxylesterase
MRLLAPLLLVPFLAAQQPPAQQAPAQPRPQRDRTIPPAGIEVPPQDRQAIETGLARLGAAMQQIRGLDLAPDVEIFYRAVKTALDNNEFLRPPDIAAARRLLAMGNERADQLRRGEAPWTRATGLVVRGYVSKIDKTVQPYGLVIPESYSPAAPRRWRLDTWFHGRNETLTEVAFLADRIANPGQFTPPEALVLHLYGRYCNANKFAGEVDLFEALEDVKRRYPIDEDRIVVRGFSMGGASAWHFAAHHAWLWAAAAPGAGFSETPEFLRIDRTRVKINWWEEKLWSMYNASDYAVNFAQCPVVAYNGDQDGQKQAADVMERELTKEGIRLRRVVGPQTGHRYHPDSIVEINSILDGIAARGRNRYPATVRFTTFTLAYNRMNWVVVDALGKHWERARVDAEITGPSSLKLATSNVTALTLEFEPGGCPLDMTRKAALQIDGQKLDAPAPMSDRSWRVHLRKTGAQWTLADKPDQGGLRKRHKLQGPIDDAFMDSFVFVRPTGEPRSPGVAGWVKSEMDRAIREWRRQFRGDAQVRDDSAVTDADIAASNLVLWGDPSSNSILARIADKLPVKWTAQSVELGTQKFDAAAHAPILIYPNPLNPSKYVVLNSGFTFRDYDHLNNARQVPKLPDYAIIDTTTAPDARYPGKITAAGFFDESWRLAP